MIDLAKRCDMNKLRHFCCTAVLLTAVLLLTGCGSKLKTEEELLVYASRYYGDCTLLSTVSENKSRTLTLHDTAYGFDYSVSSRIEKVPLNIDGSSSTGLMVKEQVTRSDFDVCLSAWIEEQCRDALNEIAARHQAVMQFEQEDVFGLSDWNVTAAPDEVPTMAEECLAVIAQYDPAQRLKGFIFFYDENHGYIGECVLSDRRYSANSAYSPQGSCTAFNRIS